MKLRVVITKPYEQVFFTHEAKNSIAQATLKPAKFRTKLTTEKSNCSL